MPTAEAAAWWGRNRGAATADWIANYQRSVEGRQRTVIAETVQAIGADTLLEVGCHCGPNLVRLAREMTELRMVGIDVSADAIRSGRQWVEEEGLADRIQLNVGRIPEALEPLPSGAFDVVLTCYSLVYVDPADLDATLYEFGRLATKAVVLVEPMAGKAEDVMTATGYQEWVHDYRERAPWIGTLRNATIGTRPIDPPVNRLTDAVVLVAA